LGSLGPTVGAARGSGVDTEVTVVELVSVDAELVGSVVVAVSGVGEPLPEVVAIVASVPVPEVTELFVPESTVGVEVSPALVPTESELLETTVDAELVTVVTEVGSTVALVAVITGGSELEVELSCRKRTWAGRGEEAAAVAPDVLDWVVASVAVGALASTGIGIRVLPSEGTTPIVSV
jgi:hypothetical protein